MPRIKPWQSNLLLAAGSTLIGLMACELLLRHFLPYERGSHRHPGSITRDQFLTDGRLGQYNELLGWTLKPNVTILHRTWEVEHTITTNSRGFRDDEIPYERQPGKRRILILGDSFMMGDGVERRFNFADLLKQELDHTEVVNLGVSGYGTDQEFLLYATEGRRYRPDVVLLALTIDNDFEDNIRDKRYGLYKPYFVFNGDKLDLKGVPVPRVAPADSAGPPDSLTHSPFPLHDFLDARSALYASVFDWLSRIPALTRRWEASGLIYSSPMIYYSSQVGILSVHPSPPQEAAWKLTLALLEAWREAVIREGSHPVLFLIPSQIQVYPRQWKQVVDRYGLKPGDFDPDYPNQRLLQFCRDVGLDVIDPLPDFRAAAARGGLLYFRRNPHWNREGHMLAARIAARELKTITRIGVER